MHTRPARAGEIPAQARVRQDDRPVGTSAWVLIPAYEPDDRLVELVAALRDVPDEGLFAGIVVVDDGSGPAYALVFDAVARLGATVLTHQVNRGKAAALRTGTRWILTHAPGSDVVCADSDGQHRPDDIARVARTLAGRAEAGEPQAIVLGSRRFVGDVPLRSRFGNRMTTALMALATGTWIGDTQTGLRGYPAAMLPWVVGVPGERFAYELRVLLEAIRMGRPVVEVGIATVYLDDNASSHFRPVADSLRVMVPLVLFAASGLVAFGVDTLGVLVLEAVSGSLLVAVIGARIVSSAVNFLVNRRVVFGAHREGETRGSVGNVVPESVDSVSEPADAVLGSADVVPGSVDVSPEPVEVVPGSVDVVPGSVDVVPEPVEGTVATRGTPSDDPAHGTGFSPPIVRQALRYAALAVPLLAAGYVGLWVLTGVGVPLLAAKVLTDATLWVTSYVVQRRFVFARG